MGLGTRRGERRQASKGTRQVRAMAVALTLILVGLAVYYLLFLRRGPSILERGPKEVSGATWLFTVYGPGTNPTPLFNRPLGVGTDRSGGIYVSDTGNNRICVFTDKGEFVREFGGTGVAYAVPGARSTWEPGLFNSPYGIDVSDSGEIYVADMNNRRLQVFSAGGRFARLIPPAAPEGAKEDYRLAMSPTNLDWQDGRLYVCDRWRIAVFTDRGRLLQSIGKHRISREPGGFDRPNGVAVAPDGTVYVSDNNNLRVQKLSAKNKVIRSIGKAPPLTPAQRRSRTFGIPRGIDLDAEGRLYVVDASRSSVLIFSPSGKLLAQFGSRGEGPGQMNFPNDVAVAPDGTIYVADKENNRIQAFTLTE